MNKAAQFLLLAGAATIVLGTLTQKQTPPHGATADTATSAQPATPSATPPSPEATDDANWSKHLDEALAAVKKENAVRSAAWLNRKPASLLAGVIDDGSRQDGYAEYLCTVLADHEIQGAIVRVMDVASAARSEGQDLGRADCATGPVEWVDFTKQPK